MVPKIAPPSKSLWCYKRTRPTPRDLKNRLCYFMRCADKWPFQIWYSSAFSIEWVLTAHIRWLGTCSNPGCKVSQSYVLSSDEHSEVSLTQCPILPPQPPCVPGLASLSQVSVLLFIWLALSKRSLLASRQKDTDSSQLAAATETRECKMTQCSHPGSEQTTACYNRKATRRVQTFAKFNSPLVKKSPLVMLKKMKKDPWSGSAPKCNGFFLGHATGLHV